MQEKELAAVIEPILAEHGLELDGLQVTPIGRRSVLRVTVDGDGPTGRGPLLDDIAAASSAVSAALDESAAVGDHPYTLEVSSRGVSAPLTAAKHYRRNTGRLVKAWLGGDVVTGRVVAVTDADVTLDVDGAERTLSLADVTKAVVQVELNRLPDDEFGEDA
ncbi:ribosome maturation factor RimP [Tessaracoccus lapidicaptus]|jgi:ribosome maturation factor RimP|uniref:Ribosome maturation factor RimP n=1 Tax=Tessaracoccus lapidicaptus TaxID=1427523 RepID=A0A1C0AIB7_9ACTN|nr:MULTISPECIES: ribosome maturation factor RimP [Tessaracoccus]AQX16820.1 ribosome maturation factor RimP [Tessaracoccus sp. T2.5-30]OCL31795.1 ribosome maturation factor RimP [Tessaracoccus lapidicaptus]VEP41602.1 Ribosome maturation factor RimP [Tessaracoccus lapidicaptus]